MKKQDKIFFVSGLPRSGTTAAIRGIRTFSSAYAIPYELAIPEILYRLNYSSTNTSFKPAFRQWVERAYQEVLYRCSSDPDQDRFDGDLLRLYKIFIDQIAGLANTSELLDKRDLGRLAQNFFLEVLSESSREVLVEKTPSSALYEEQVISISPLIKTIFCIREPSSFLESCRGRRDSSIAQVKSGFEGSESDYFRQLIYYFSRITRSLADRQSGYLLQHECISMCPRTACSYLHSILFGRPPDLAAINKFNGIVGLTSNLGRNDYLFPFANDLSLFAELGYPAPALSKQDSSKIFDNSQEAFNPLYGLTQTSGKWFKADERFQALVIRNHGIVGIELELLCDCSLDAKASFRFEAIANHAELLTQWEIAGDSLKIRIDLSRLPISFPTLIDFRATSLIGNFLLGHCSDDLHYNIILDIKSM